MISDTVEYLQSLESIRSKCQLVFKKAQEDKLECFDLDLSKLKDASDLIVSLIERDYGPLNKKTLKLIPPHGRWLHFGKGRVEGLIDLTGDKALEAVLDLFVVAVLLDAGAGDRWSFKDPLTSEVFSRSEGLAVASYHMFINGMFSSDPANKYQVDSDGLQSFSLNELAKAFQVSEDNPLVGFEGRFYLLQRLGKVICEQKPYFSRSIIRPSSFMTFLKERATNGTIKIDDLWEVVVKGFGSIWPPAGAKINGTSLGDAWTLSNPKPYVCCLRL